MEEKQFLSFQKANDFARNIATQNEIVDVRIVRRPGNRWTVTWEGVMSTVDHDFEDDGRKPHECLWADTLQTFLSTPSKSILNSLQYHHAQKCLDLAGSSQIIAWESSIEVLKNTLENFPPDTAVIFEYFLPRESGRRPDVILLTGQSIMVLEFKEYDEILNAHIDQVATYARDLNDYHSFCRNKNVIPLLILAKGNRINHIHRDVHIHSSDTLKLQLQSLVEQDLHEEVRLEEFLEGDYSPLPSIVSAAKTLFDNDPLPHIHRAESAGIPQTIECLHKLANKAISDGTKLIILVTGVPGSGKTLVGLQFVYDLADNEQSNAVFLSGNGPLVKVLRHTLQSNVFVQPVHGFLHQYGGNTHKRPHEKIWIYDEAQRAWDDERACRQRGPNALSEPKDFVRLGSRTPGGCVILGLIGEGQEIHIGEEAGISQWNEAIGWSNEELNLEWSVACPKHLSGLFSKANESFIDDKLNLDCSLRTHRASDLQMWVSHVLEGKLSSARSLASTLAGDNYPIYYTRALNLAKKHACDAYGGFEEKRYGLLASSKAKNLVQYGVDNSFQATQMPIGPWYVDPPSNNQSCCQLREVATEFSCQGLELDFPIVVWGNDLTWEKEQKRWISRFGGNQARNPHQLRINSYRVLLTRGRDGMVIFIPKDYKMDQTAEALIEAGCHKLEVGI